MKKKILSIGSLLMLTATMFYFSGCKDAIEDALIGECYTCSKAGEVDVPTCDTTCSALGLCKSDLESDGYTCTRN